MNKSKERQDFAGGYDILGLSNISDYDFRPVTVMESGTGEGKCPPKPAYGAIRHIGIP